MLDFVRNGWKGGERLWKVTWLGYVGGVMLLVIALVGVGAALGEAAGYVFGPLILVVNVWGLVAMWRCAPNVNWRGWFYLARVLVVMAVVGWALDIAGV